MTREERNAFYTELGYEHRIFIDDFLAQKIIAEDMTDYYIRQYQRKHPEVTKDQLKVAREIAKETAYEIFMEFVKDENLPLVDYRDVFIEATDYKEE